MVGPTVLHRVTQKRGPTIIQGYQPKQLAEKEKPTQIPPTQIPPTPAASAASAATAATVAEEKTITKFINDPTDAKFNTFYEELIGDYKSIKKIIIPSDAPIMDNDAFKLVKEKIVIKEYSKTKTTPILLNSGSIVPQNKFEPTTMNKKAEGVYTPISNPQFSKFVDNLYSEYSSGVKRDLDEFDKDACKKRNPNKIETFYYQNFVRDFLVKGSPYRGLLGYHGLGTGKTCTSIVAAEALYWGGQKKIFVLTPATLSNNYRKDLGKCGFFPLRQNNFWSFLSIGENRMIVPWLTQVLGLPPSLVEAQGGGWVPDPFIESNWETLSPGVQASIRNQQNLHLNFRFKFIHYNGILPQFLSRIASLSVINGTSIFDNAVVVIDEVHNLVRTINGSMIGKSSTAEFIKKNEPHEFSWSTPEARKHKVLYTYPRGYSLYRLLQNAVGIKIIALSATPMINYAQELAILLNIIGGEQRMVEINCSNLGKGAVHVTKLIQWATARQDIDFFKFEDVGGQQVLNVTPVPFGFKKIENRRFVRIPPSSVISGADGITDFTEADFDIGDPKKSRERNMDWWAYFLLADLNREFLRNDMNMIKSDIVTSRKTKIPLQTTAIKLHTFPLLPDFADDFVGTFIDRTTLKIKKETVLQRRAMGLISYYRGGSEELMPRVGKNIVVNIPMSELMFNEYSAIRKLEISRESSSSSASSLDAVPQRTTKKASAVLDLYAQATKKNFSGFKTASRAACNWIFPIDIPRPKMSEKENAMMLGIQATIRDDEEEEVDIDVDAEYEIEDESESVGIGDGDRAAQTKKRELIEMKTKIASIVGLLMKKLEDKSNEYLNTNLNIYSPKFSTIITTLLETDGPVLVYSQFKTLEGLGIFSAALRASDQQFIPLDIQKGEGGEWEIPAELMSEEAIKRPRYIRYDGDSDQEKRKLLLQLYNADISSLPPKLSTQCAVLMDGDPDNRYAKVCKVFMITASGAEGISLFNTRQVHIMEPYWNNVRTQQVAGRAIRLCSHMNLPWDERVVDVYTYLTVFSIEQKASGDKAVMTADGGLTVDEGIMAIAVKKQTLANGLSSILQMAAADCGIHQKEHENKCMDPPTTQFTFHPNWRSDLLL